MHFSFAWISIIGDCLYFYEKVDCNHPQGLFLYLHIYFLHVYLYIYLLFDLSFHLFLVEITYHRNYNAEIFLPLTANGVEHFMYEAQTPCRFFLAELSDLES